MLEFFKSLFNRKVATVAFDDDRITKLRPDGKTESIPWNELREIHIVTTDAGPYVDDVFWVLVGTENACIVPSGSEGIAALLARVQALPGFDNMAVVEAMGSTDHDKFVVWKYR